MKISKTIAYILILLVIVGFIILWNVWNSIQKGPLEPTPLHYAALNGDINTVKLYLNSPSEINKRGSLLTRYPETPLSLAAWAGHKDIAELLIANGADVNLSSPLFNAVNRGRTNIVKLLLDNGAKIDTSLAKEAEECGNVEIIKLLMEHGLDLKDAAKNDDTNPLRYAAGGGQTEMVEFLISQGVPINPPAGHRSAISQACVGNHLDIVKLLIKYGADTNIKDSDGKTTLHLAVLTQDINTVKLCLENGANPNLKDKKDQTPLDYTKLQNNPEIIDLLKKYMKKE